MPEGVTGDSVKPPKTTFEITGNFDAVALLTALNAAGFNAMVRA